MRLPLPLVGWLKTKLMQLVANRRPPDVVIGSKEKPYLRRWWVIPRNKWFNIYLHNVLRSDDDRALHDHPWANLSILLSGGYDEITPDYDPDGIPLYQIEVFHWRPPGTVILRGPTSAHRLMIPDEGKNQEVWSLFITGPNVRSWGFWCPKGWKHWKDFTAFHTTGASHEIGPGCGD